MRPGPRPTPIAILKLRGSWRGEYLRKNEPKAEGLPETPDYLSDAEKDMFNSLVEQLDVLGIIGAIDEYELARYCALWTIYKMAITEGLKLSTILKLSDLLLRIEKEFAMTPASRAGFNIPKPPTADPLQDLMNRQRKNS